MAGTTIAGDCPEGAMASPMSVSRFWRIMSMAGSAYAEIEEKMEGVSANICCDGWSLRCTRWSQGEEHTSSTGIFMGIGQHLRLLLALHDEAGEAVKKRCCQQTLVLAVRVDVTEINLSSSTLHAAFENHWASCLPKHHWQRTGLLRRQLLYRPVTKTHVFPLCLPSE